MSDEKCVFVSADGSITLNSDGATISGSNGTVFLVSAVVRQIADLDKKFCAAAKASEKREMDARFREYFPELYSPIRK